MKFILHLRKLANRMIQTKPYFLNLESIISLSLFWIAIALNPYSLNAQSNYPLKIALSNESTAIPYTLFFTTPIHPTIQLGTEYFYDISDKHDFYQTANIGYIFHNYLYQGIYINTGVGYDYKFDFGFKLKSNFELGYLHTFSTQEEYQLKDGEYVNGPDWGNARLMPMLSLGFGYIFKKEAEVKSEIFFLYKSWIEFPYSPGFIPVMTHINFELGYTYYIDWKDEK